MGGPLEELIKYLKIIKMNHVNICVWPIWHSFAHSAKYLVEAINYSLAEHKIHCTSSLHMNFFFIFKYRTHPRSRSHILRATLRVCSRRNGIKCSWHVATKCCAPGRTEKFPVVCTVCRQARFRVARGIRNLARLHSILPRFEFLRIDFSRPLSKFLHGRHVDKRRRGQ